MRSLREIGRSAKKTELVWRFGSNLVPTLDYFTGHRSQGDDRDLVDTIDRDGVAITSIDRFVHLLPFYEELIESTEELVSSLRDEIDSLRMHVHAGKVGGKTFNLETLGNELTLNPTDPFARFALNQTFLTMANAYFRMRAKLRYYNVWYTAASHSSARESQLWHFDREDNYILKVFLYLKDVDEGTGPFTYAPGTHRKGRYRSIKPEFFLEGGVRRTTDEQMNAVYSKENWKVCTGKKGTIVFADTRGYHKGGEARTKDRLMFTCMYTSPASESKKLIHFPEDLDRSLLTKGQIQALGLD